MHKNRIKPKYQGVAVAGASRGRQWRSGTGCVTERQARNGMHRSFRPVADREARLEGAGQTVRCAPGSGRFPRDPSQRPKQMLDVPIIQIIGHQAYMALLVYVYNNPLN